MVAAPQVHGLSSLKRMREMEDKETKSEERRREDGGNGEMDQKKLGVRKSHDETEVVGKNGGRSR